MSASPASPRHGISTHVLDLETGQPASGVIVTLERELDEGFEFVRRETTDADGRIPDLMRAPLSTGRYRLTFDVAGYMRSRGVASLFLEQVALTVNVDDTARHYHVPLLVTRYACSSYRGS